MKRVCSRAALALTAALAVRAVPVRAVVVPSFCERAMRSALDSDAAWKMTRTVPGSAKTLVSTGVVSCAAGRGIVWKVLSPFPETITMTASSMTFEDEDGARTKPLAELKHYDAIRREADRFLAGDPKAFDGAVSAETSVAADGRWTVTFKPGISGFDRLLKQVSVTGLDTVEKAVLENADGGVSTIEFASPGRGAHSLWPGAKDGDGANARRYDGDGATEGPAGPSPRQFPEGAGK